MSRADGDRADNVDLDRLADYVAGTLEPGAAGEVARLVEADGRWAAALDSVITADEMVRADLSLLARSDELAMPDDVVARLDDALGRIGPGAPVVSLATARADRMRRRHRFTTGLAAAATVVAVICGITVVTRSGSMNEPGGTAAQAERDTGADAGAPPAAAPGPPALDPSAPDQSAGPDYVATGANYTAADLRQLALKPTGGLTSVAPQFSAGPSEQEADPVPNAVRRAVAGPLSRLTDPPALTACLAAIQAEHPGAVRLVDFARYEGAPALVVLLQLGSTTTVVVAGPNCGLGGADQRAAVSNP